MIEPASAVNYREFSALSKTGLNFTAYFSLIINALPYPPDSYNFTGKNM